MFVFHRKDCQAFLAETFLLEIFSTLSAKYYKLFTKLFNLLTNDLFLQLIFIHNFPF
jgi:hypothetical protein